MEKYFLKVFSQEIFLKNLYHKSLLKRHFKFFEFKLKVFIKETFFKNSENEKCILKRHFL